MRFQVILERRYVAQVEVEASNFEMAKLQAMKQADALAWREADDKPTLKQVVQK
jgi:hypothetical protein